MMRSSQLRVSRGVTQCGKALWLSVLMSCAAYSSAYSWEDPQHSNSLVRLLFTDYTTNLTTDTSSVATNHGDVQYGTGSEPTWIAATKSTVANYDFDGANDVILVDSSDTLDGLGDLTDSFTLACWFKTTKSYASKAGVVINKWNGSEPSIRLRIVGDNKLQFRLHDGSGHQNIKSAGTVNDGEWHLGVCVRDLGEDKIKLYVDGTLVNSATDARGDCSSNDKVSIGNGGSGYTAQDFDGEIYRPTIYKTALSSNEVFNLYQYTSPTNKNEGFRLRL